MRRWRSVDIALHIRELEGKIAGISRHSSRVRRRLDEIKRLEEQGKVW